MRRGLVLVTGASKGIGKAIAVALARDGFDLILWARSEDQLAQVKQQCEEFGVSAHTQCVDVSQWQMVHEASTRFAHSEPLAGVVINAGIGVWQPLDKVSIEQWHETQAVNLNGAFYTLKGTMPGLSRAGSGRVVVIGSDASVFPFPDRTAYCASKWGLAGLVESLREELRPSGVSITHLLPSRVDTEFFGSGNTSRKHALRAEDVAAITAFIFSLPVHIEIRTLSCASMLETFGPFPAKMVKHGNGPGSRN